MTQPELKFKISDAKKKATQATIAERFFRDLQCFCKCRTTTRPISGTLFTTEDYDNLDRRNCQIPHQSVALVLGQPNIRRM